MLPVIFGLAGTELTDNEKKLLLSNYIYGIILFARNVESKEQVQALTSSIRKLSINPEINILIDEEGGRITRLSNIYVEPLPSAQELGSLFNTDPHKAIADITACYTKIAHRLHELGINITCAPVADLYHPETHAVIGDRAFSDDPKIVVRAARIAADTLIQHNIIPVIKHIPGHGRAQADSHLELPLISAPLSELEESDFNIFKGLNHYPLAMTAHIIYECLDKQKPVTLSEIAMGYVRTSIGFTGKIMTDDIGMKALAKYSLEEIISCALAAKCDYILHCDGNWQAMSEIVDILKSKMGEIKNA